MQHHDGIENRQEPERLGFAGLVVDRDGHSLTDAAGKDVPLTPPGFVLLASFARGAGRALSRDHLLQAVAGREARGFRYAPGSSGSPTFA